MDLSVVPYTHPISQTLVPDSGAGAAASPETRYRECLRNHAAALGGQAFDGCGEFMPTTVDPLKCAACGCHRNFHRRDNNHHHPLPLPPPPPLLLYTPNKKPQPAPAPPGFPPFLPLPYRAIQPSPVSSAPPTPPEGGGRKRFRTRFTAVQKEKMQAFAERLGWRIPRHDDKELLGFCGEIGVDRHVLKVWMHNNKHHHHQSSPAAEEMAVDEDGDADDGVSGAGGAASGASTAISV